MSPVITESRVGRRTRERAKKKRGKEKQPIGLIIAYVSTNEIPYVVLFKLLILLLFPGSV